MMKTFPVLNLLVGLPLVLWVPGPLRAQDASKVQPSAYRVVQDNASVRVLEYTSRPGMGVCGSGMHSHPAHLTILLTPAKVRVTEKGKSFQAGNKVGEIGRAHV